MTDVRFAVAFTIPFPQTPPDQVGFIDEDPILLAVSAGLDASAEDYDTSRLDIKEIRREAVERPRYVVRQAPDGTSFGVIDRGPDFTKNVMVQNTGPEVGRATKLANVLNDYWKNA